MPTRPPSPHIQIGSRDVIRIEDTMQLMVRSRNRLAMAVRETSYIKLRGAMEQEEPAGDGGGGGCGFSLIPRPR